MLIFVRHGKTKLNDEDAEKSRGWLPVPLSLEGMKMVHDTAEGLEGLEDVKHIYCSDLVRGVQTAHEIAHSLSMVIEPEEQLRDWDVGDYTGKAIKDILPDTHALIDNPKKPAPGGEAYQDFLDRCVPFLEKLVASEDTNIAVSHARVVTLLKALCKNKGEYPDTPTLKKKAPIDPAGIMIVQPGWKIVYQSEVEED